MTSSLLFSQYRLGQLALSSRIVMAPMTRSRCVGNVPDDEVAQYYAQRASAGLIVTEGTSPSPNGLGYPRIPGLFSEAQAAGWRKVTEAVHNAGGKIFVQLMHTGRVGHANNLPPAGRVLAPSAIAAPGEMYTDKEGPRPHPVPEAMTEREIQEAIEEYATASRYALSAGFDGVELHGANGYLIEQFLNTASNQRSDRWGGSVENRIRFALAVVDAAKEAIGASRLGIRLSPYGVFGGMVSDATTDELFTELAEKLNERGVAYLHVLDHSSMGAPKPKPELFATLRKSYKGTTIRAGGFDKEKAEAVLAAHEADLVAFGRPFLANPNLPDKLRRGAPLTAPDPSTFYTPGPKGYTDYPES